MSDEQDSMADIIQTFKITPEEIVEKTIPSTELYELKVGSQVLSPFWVETLKKQIESGSPLFTPDIQIRALGTEEWFELFTHPTFQRRQVEESSITPNEVSNADQQQIEEEPDEDEGSAEFYILAKGQKVGPITLKSLREKIGTHEILVTDLISHDNGETWSKIFEMPEFDRRSLGQRDHLPHLPQDDIFRGSKKEVLDNLKDGDREGETIFNLVHLGRKKNEEDIPIHTTPIVDKDDDEEFFSEKTISMILIIISLIGIGYFVKAEFFAPKKRITKRSRSIKRERPVPQRTQRKELSRPQRADAPPPPPDRRPERPPRRPSRSDKSFSKIQRDRPARMPDSQSRNMRRKPLIEDNNYSNNERPDRNQRDGRRPRRGDRYGNDSDRDQGQDGRGNRGGRPSRGTADNRSMNQDPQDGDERGFDDNQGRDVASQQSQGQDEPYQDSNNEMDQGQDPSGQDNRGSGDNFDEPPPEQDIY